MGTVFERKCVPESLSTVGEISNGHFLKVPYKIYITYPVQNLHYVPGTKLALRTRSDRDTGQFLVFGH